MRKFLLCAVAMALVSCQEDAGEAPLSSPGSEEGAAALSGIDGGSLSGTYTATDRDGLVLTQELRLDGTVTTTGPDGLPIEGRYTGGTQDEPFCITNPGDTRPACYAYSYGEEGERLATNIDDPTDVWIIERAD